MNKLLMNKILIANRGEIACRIHRTAQKMNIKTVGLYNDADRDAKHTSMVDEAYYIGSNTLSDSYLNMQKILNIAKQTGAHAVHPGYGFLSENCDFVDMLEKNNVTFIGPPSNSIRAMGNKSESKNVMQKANVPVVTGYHGSNQDDKFLFEEAKKIGFPVLIKAVLGGGGKGMRAVFNEADFFAALDSARREAMKSFSDDNMLVEKFIQKPKHIEVQVFGDRHGNYVHLFERDCSIQRRHQKIIEEAPSFLSPEKRHEIGQSAIKAAEAVGYYNAGTVEFIFDTIANKHYFMEMNTRLQVEHPISEEISGQDFVEWQIRVARGEKLPLDQSQLKINGHSIESRIYAEDPDTDFLPQSGTLHYLREPRNRDSLNPDQDVRVDTGVRQEDDVSIFFDPMVSKLIVHGKDREDAIQKMHNALSNYKIVGLKNNISFLRKICEEKAFLDNNYDTDFIENYRESLFEQPFTVIEPAAQDIMNTVLIELMNEKRHTDTAANDGGRHTVDNPWYTSDSFRINYVHKRQITLIDQHDTETLVDIRYLGTNQFELKLSDQDDTHYRKYTTHLISENFIEIESETQKQVVEFFLDSSNTVHTMREEGGVVALKVHHEDFQDAEGVNTADMIAAPMPGKIVKIFAKQGDAVTKGQSILSLESMKMEYLIKAERSGTIKDIHTAETEFVQIGAKLIEYEATPE
jgi:3-methylcrotonyl-CoA carboxylase alpha subunit